MGRHLPGGLSQSNKAPKRRHDSKRELKRSQKGKIERTGAKQSLKGRKSGGKAARFNLAKQMREQKRLDQIESRRIVGGPEGAPKIVGIIALDKGVKLQPLMDLIEGHLHVSPHSATTVLLPEQNTRLTFILSESRHVLDVLDVAKAADILVCCVSAGSGMDVLAQRGIGAISTQGMPTVVGLIQGMSSITHRGAKLEEKRKRTKEFETAFGTGVKVMVTDDDSEAKSLIRVLGELTPKAILWRDIRPYILAESIEVEGGVDGKCSVAISGYLRGASLSASDLVHVMHVGTYGLSTITAAADPCPVSLKRRKIDTMDTDSVTVLDSVDPSKQDPLVPYNTPDPLAGEQTWPTAEEMAAAREAEKARITGVSGRKSKRSVPQGTSEYQAAWYPSDEEYSEMDDDSMREEEEEEEEEESVVDAEKEENAWMEDMNALKEHQDDKKDMTEEAEEQEKFPDEVDTPMDVPARTRFARYRGLRNFRHAEWDVNEMLPLPYSRIYRFSNFNAAQREAMAESDGKAVGPGKFIRVSMMDVPNEIVENEIGLEPGSSAAQTAFGRPIILSGFLKNENKMSVLHFSITRSTHTSEPLKSKDAVVFHSGFRTPYIAHPIYSDDIRTGSGGQSSGGACAKFERYLLPGRSSVATVYAPVVFGSQPLLVFGMAQGDHVKGIGSCLTSAGTQYSVSSRDLSSSTLIASGSLINVNPDRVILKRILLTGLPFKVHRNKVTARFMFFTPEDIKWFRPVKLHTKYGKHGHIIMPLGTHGRMKCVFDGVVMQNDTIIMPLYKRQFPVWDGPELEDQLLDYDD